MRGIHEALADEFFPYGITPAYAGNTDRIYVKGALNQDHPRLCGEYYSRLDHKSPGGGSPPPMRGIPFKGK